MSGGGSVNASGLFSSGTIAGGPYAITASSGAVSGTASVTVGSPFTMWRAGLFTPEQLADTSISGVMAVPTNDGIPNLIKYALNLNPMTPGTAGLPTTGTAVIGGTNFLTLSYAQVKAATDIIYAVEVSGDMLTWNSGAGYTAPVGTTDKGTTQTVVVRDLVPLSSATKRFIRLRVTLP